MKSTVLILGLGITGMSVARFLSSQGRSFIGCDAKLNDEMRSSYTESFPGMACYTDLPDALWDSIACCVASPGVPLTAPPIQRCRALSIPVMGDIDLFAEQNTEPVVGITGSNGKSTVTALVGEMAQAQGLKPAVMGNIGEPVLDFLGQDYDVAVMELSSFQLEICESLAPTVAVITNITPDHLDRHGSMEAYAAAKHRIYERATHAVCNLDDRGTWPQDPIPTKFFSLLPDPRADWRYDVDQQKLISDQHTFSIAALPNPTRPYISNVLTSLCVAAFMGWDPLKCFKAACAFPGLPHRLQRVMTQDGIYWFDDSKATNVSASVVAIESVAEMITGKQYVILGGLAKDDDFNDLIPPLVAHAHAAIVLGRCQDVLLKTLSPHITCHAVKTLQEAVHLSKQLAQKNDAVVLAPACASFDMFNNYKERGHCFVNTVRELQ